MVGPAAGLVPVENDPKQTWPRFSGSALNDIPVLGLSCKKSPGEGNEAAGI